MLDSRTLRLGGDLPVHRLGFGAMRLTGPGIWGEPDDRAEAIAVLRRALDVAKLGDTEKIDGFKRLDRFVQAIERKTAPEANFDAVVAHEHAISPQLEGRSVFDRPGKGGRSTQLRLFP